MQLIQQKLIWFLGCGSLLLILYRKDLLSKVVSRQGAAKLKAGMFLLTAGAGIGVLSQLGLLGRWLTTSGASFYLESLIGYVIGGWLIVWSAIEWSQDYSSRNGDSLSKSKLRQFTERASAIILDEHAVRPFLEKISKYLHLALDCQAITFHRQEDDNSLTLDFQSGLPAEAEEMLRRPQKESLFYATSQNMQIMSSDSPSELHSKARLQVAKGAIGGGLSVPLVSDGEVLGILSVLFVKPRQSREEELKLLEMISSALANIIRAERAEQEYQQEAGFRELMRRISDSFSRNSSILSALIDSAKASHDDLKFDEINLYVSGNGRVRTHDYALTDGGRVNYLEGQINKSGYPYLYKEKGEGNVIRFAERHATILPFEIDKDCKAWLEIRLESEQRYLADLMRGWSLLIAREIGLEHLKKEQHQTSQWLGAIRHYQERALTSDNVPVLLKEMAAMVADLGMATFCRISIVDSMKMNLRTAALAQIRPLSWPGNQDMMPISKTATLRKALESRKCIEFDQENSSSRIPDEEVALILPTGVSHGLIMPLTIGDESIGLLILGEFRSVQRMHEPDPAQLFASNLAALISIVLSWHKEKMVSQEISRERKTENIIKGSSRDAARVMSKAHFGR